MLVLSRRNREAVVVGGNDAFPQMLKITVLEIAMGKVKLGFEVDGAIPVYRMELWERICAAGGLNSAEPAPSVPSVRAEE